MCYHVESPIYHIKTWPHSKNQFSRFNRFTSHQSIVLSYNFYCCCLVFFFSQSKQRIQLRPERPWANGRLRLLIWQAWSRGNTRIGASILDMKTRKKSARRALQRPKQKTYSGVNLVNGDKVVHVLDEDGGLDDAVQGRAGSLEDLTKVLHDLMGLLLDTTLDDFTYGWSSVSALCQRSTLALLHPVLSIHLPVSGMTGIWPEV